MFARASCDSSSVALCRTSVLPQLTTIAFGYSGVFYTSQTATFVAFSVSCRYQVYFSTRLVESLTAANTRVHSRWSVAGRCSERCKKALKPNGVIVIKENVQQDREDAEEFYGFEVDKSDNSIIRTVEQYRQIFSDAQLEVVLEMKQRGFPPPFFSIHMFALRPQEVR